MGDSFCVGQTYTRQQIQDVLGCEGEGYLPHRGSKVVCGNFTLRYNPDAPDIILPGRGGGIEYWGQVFCKQDFSIPIFIKGPSAYLWKYVGDYQVDRYTEAREEVASQNRRSRRNDITRVIYLKTSSKKAMVAVNEEEPPSEEQKRIYAFQENGDGDLFIEAVAGSGKTTTLLGLATRLPLEQHREALFVAFNRSVANKLVESLPAAIKASTIHAIGYFILRRASDDPNALPQDKDKYKHLVTAALPDGESPGGSVHESITKLIHFVMMTLTEPMDQTALQNLSSKYEIAIEDWSVASRVVVQVINRGKSEWKTGVSFDDMIYLPNVLTLPIPQRRMIYCDEAQDLSAAQRELVLKLRSPGGRIFFVGDKNQAIYGFAGADSDSVTSIVKATKATELPLNTCYRCPSTHIALAQEIVADIQPRPGADEGTIDEITEDDLFTHQTARVQRGDMILCRVAAPLINMVLRLRAANVSAKVRGNDIGIQWADTVTEALGGSINWPVFSERLEEHKKREVNKLRAVRASDLAIESLLDRTKSITHIYQQVLDDKPSASESDLRTAIKNLFTDDAEDPNAVLMSTVHRAKGLESNRVFILRQELMPHPKAKTEEERQQEQNLRYVALTRSKQALYFVEAPSKP